jgi:MYXO-CTERM domain-containing protein
MKHLFPRLAIIGAAVVTALAATAPARPMFPSDQIPPPLGHYINNTDSISYLGGFVVIRNIDHFAFSASFPPPTGFGTNFDNFNSLVSVDASVNNGPFSPLQGNASTTVRVTHTGTIGPISTYDTEMLALNIAGGSLPAGVMLRESPTLASLGQTTITNLGGGLFNIDSFFDIFTELSLDGGQTWNPGSSSTGGPERVHLVPAPPGALALLGVGLLTTRRRRA